MLTISRGLAALAVLATLFVSAGLVHASDQSGREATVASSRAPGGYNNYCQTWAVYAPQARALFGAC